VWGEQALRVTKPAAHRTCRAPRREKRSAVSQVREEFVKQGRGRGTPEAETAPGRVR
jgi:hypothetical protein